MMNEVSGTLRPPDGHKAQIVRQEGDGGCLKRSDSPNRETIGRSWQGFGFKPPGWALVRYSLGEPVSLHRGMLTSTLLRV